MNKQNDPLYILNPKSKRYVLKSGTTGKQIIASQKEDYLPNGTVLVCSYISGEHTNFIFYKVTKHDRNGIPLLNHLYVPERKNSEPGSDSIWATSKTYLWDGALSVKGTYRPDVTTGDSDEHGKTPFKIQGLSLSIVDPEREYTVAM